MGKQGGSAGGQDIDSARGSVGSMLTYRCIFVMDFCDAGEGRLAACIRTLTPVKLIDWEWRAVTHAWRLP